jgi:hypothetical protein
MAAASAAVWFGWDIDAAAGVGDVLLSVAATVAGHPGTCRIAQRSDGWRLAWAGYAADRTEASAPGPDLAGVADLLAGAVRLQWEKEAALRRLNDPHPGRIMERRMHPTYARLRRMSHEPYARSGAPYPT